ncbi:hypothetical protein X949_5952 [Burkholderia pseudomallei MSHR5609]|nr:hypothetical protein X949_5952 [Burkholderia pseudomallei MSHR5609]
MPGSKLSRAVASFSFTDHRHRRSGPINTSITSCLLLVENTVVCLLAILSEDCIRQFRGLPQAITRGHQTKLVPHVAQTLAPSCVSPPKAKAPLPSRP